MADAFVLLLLDSDAADAGNEEHGVISLKLRISGLKGHEVRDDVFLQLRVSVSAWPSADAEDLFYFGIVKAGEHDALADIACCACDDDFHSYLSVLIKHLSILKSQTSRHAIMQCEALGADSRALRCLPYNLKAHKC
jgi:hypothetical protein